MFKNIKLLQIILFFIICCQTPLQAQQWDYSQIKFTGKYVAEVYSMRIENNSILNDSLLICVKSFNDKNYLVEEVEKEGIIERNIYDKDGKRLLNTSYFYDRTPIDVTKTEYQYINGLSHSITYYKRINNNFLKRDKILYSYKFNQKGQVIEETLKNEAGEKNYDSYTIYDPKYKPIKPYFDKFGNQILPGSIETKVVIKGNISHYNLYKFNAEGRVIQYIHANKDKAPSDTYDYEYDLVGREIAYNYTTGSNFNSRHEFEYNNDGRIIKEREWKLDTNKELVLVEEIHYHYILINNI